MRPSDLPSDQLKQGPATQYKSGASTQQHVARSFKKEREGRTFTRVIGTLATKVLGRDPRRLSVSIQNLGPGTVYFGFGSEPALVGGVYNGGIRLLANEEWEPSNSDSMPTNDIYIVSDTANTNTTITEVVEIER